MHSAPDNNYIHVSAFQFICLLRALSYNGQVCRRVFVERTGDFRGGRKIDGFFDQKTLFLAIFGVKKGQKRVIFGTPPPPQKGVIFGGKRGGPEKPEK